MYHQNNKSLLYNPLVARGDDEHRSTTSLELLYDLVFVVAIANLAHAFTHEFLHGKDILQLLTSYLFVFFAIWLPWTSYTWFASAYDTEDAQFKFVSFVQMVGVSVIAAGVDNAFKYDDFILMLIGYIILRIPQIILWLKVALDDKETRISSLKQAFGIFIIQIFWILVIIFYPNFYLFLILALFELLIPHISKSCLINNDDIKYNPVHIEERFGLLTIIVLGEMVLASVGAIEELYKHFSIDILTSLIGSMILMFSMWWLYFDLSLADKLKDQKVAFLWSVGHYFIFASVAVIGALLSAYFELPHLSGHIGLSQDDIVMFLSIAIGIYLFFLWLTQDNIIRTHPFHRVELLVLAVLVMCIAYFTGSLFFISMAFASLNIMRLMREHKSSKTKART